MARWPSRWQTRGQVTIPGAVAAAAVLADGMASWVASGACPSEALEPTEERVLREVLARSGIPDGAGCGAGVSILDGPAARVVCELAQAGSCTLTVVGLRLRAGACLPAELAELRNLRDLELELIGAVSCNLEPLRGATQLQRLEIPHHTLDSRVVGSLEPLRALTRMRQLDLRGAGIEGSLAPLQGLTQLERLSLARTQIWGGLAALGALTQLRDLDLSNTPVQGGLEPLGGLTQMERLTLHGTQVAGSLATLRALTRLEKLDLAQTQVSGGLEALRGMTGMRDLDLSETSVAGSLDLLRNLTRMEHLTLQDMRVEGSLEPLRNMMEIRSLELSSMEVAGSLEPLHMLTRITVLTLRGLKIKGSLDALQELRQLTLLDLSGTLVAGSLEPLQQLAELRKLDLSGTGLAGPLEPLRRLTQLRTLALRDTRVAGSLDHLRAMAQARDLDLARTQVGGTLEPLRDMCGMRQLVLSATQVEGGLEPLGQLTGMRELHLDHTRVAGGLGPLRHLTLIEELELSGTRVAGSLDPLQNLSRLAQLGLRDTQVAVSLGPVRGLRRLERLSLSGLPLNMAVPDVLRAVCSDDSRLAALQAERAGVHGILASRALWVCPSLTNLNLAENRVTGVAYTWRLQRLSLAFNPLSFVADVVWRSNAMGELVLNLTGSDLDMEAGFSVGGAWRADLHVVSTRNDMSGYLCHGIQGRPLLFVSAERFAPAALCVCLAGWAGSATGCAQCAPGQYKEQVGNGDCDVCPRFQASVDDRTKCVLTQMGKAWEALQSYGLVTFLLFALPLACACLLRRGGLRDIYAVWSEPSLAPIPKQLDEHLLADQELLFYFVEAKHVREEEDILPRFQVLLVKGWVVPKTMVVKDLFHGIHSRAFLAVSHRWDNPGHPDPRGERQRLVRAFLRRPENHNVKYVWFDFWCLPQEHGDSGRTRKQHELFKYTLRNINFLYLTLPVIILLDMQYTGRFWTLFESWLAMRSASQGGLDPQDDTNCRFTIICFGNANEDDKVALLNKWRPKSLEDAIESLAKPDVYVTNQGDKDIQLQKLSELRGRVAKVFQHRNPRAGEAIGSSIFAVMHRLSHRTRQRSPMDMEMSAVPTENVSHDAAEDYERACVLWAHVRFVSHVLRPR